MDGGDVPTPAHLTVVTHPARPTLGFPLGTALLLIIIFCLSGVFSCCYHWDKLRSLRRPSHSDARLPQHSSPSPPSKFLSRHQNSKQDKDQSLPVIMPGDRFPKFMAWPCPCQLSMSVTERIMLEVGLAPSIPSENPPMPVN